MIENRHVSRVFATCPPFSLTHNFWRQIERHVASLFAPELHFNLEPTKVKRIKIIQLNCCSTNWRPQTSEKSPNVFEIAVDWWQILQGRPDMTIFKEDFTWASTSSACSLWLSRLKWHEYTAPRVIVWTLCWSTSSELVLRLTSFVNLYDLVLSKRRKRMKNKQIYVDLVDCRFNICINLKKVW